ncbi:MAG: cache domain-containing protein [Opitutaceae bacterium]
MATQTTRSYIGNLYGRLTPQFWRAQAERPGLARRVLGCTLIIGVLPLIVAAWVIPNTMRNAFGEVSRDYLSQVAQNLAANVESEMRRHVDAVEAVSKFESLREVIRQRNQSSLPPGSLEAANEQLAALVESRKGEHQGLFLCDRDGIVFAGSLRSGDRSAYAYIDIRSRAYYDAARQSGKTVISDPLRSRVDNVPIVVIAVPILDKGSQFEGLVGLSVEIQHIAAFIGSHSSRQIGDPFAIDRTGVIFAHKVPARVFAAPLGQIAGAEILASRMLRGETGEQTYRLPDGTDKLAAFAPVPIAGWSIAATMRSNEFAAATKGIQSVIVVMGVSITLVGLLAAGALSIGYEQIRMSLFEARRSDERFKLFAAAAGDVLWDLDLNARRLWVSSDSDSFLHPFTDEDSGLGALSERIPVAERSKFEGGIRRCRETGGWTGEHHITRKDGSTGYVIHRVLILKNVQGEPERMIGRLTDISDRRASEEKLAQQAELLDKTRDGIMVLDLDQTIQYWNNGATVLYGYSNGEALGAKLGELLAVDIKIPAATVLEKDEWFGILTKKNKSGEARTIDCRWTLIRDDEGRPQAILTLDTDITERRQLEAKFLRAQRLESVGTLAGGIAHDFNNLLSPIMMGVDLLKRTTQGAEGKRVIGLIEESAARAASLVKQILSFARGEAGSRVSVHLSYVVREVESIAHRTFPRNITVRLNVEKDLWLVHADPTQMNQVLMNLCVNARDAMPSGGRLTVSARNVAVDEHMVSTNRGATPGPHVLLEVSDTGTGISEANLERIFEPFFTTKELGKGTGLGLSTVIGIARDHGGFVNVYSEEGRGSVFKVYIPASGLARNQSAPVSDNLKPDFGHGELVLLVDDDPSTLNVTKQVLESSGYRVITATDGANAFSIYHAHRARISVVVTDMMMPIMDGAALIEAIRRVDPNMCFVGASGLGDNHNQIKAGELAMKHFLCKPYTSFALLAVIKASLDDRSTPFGSAIKPVAGSV